MFLFDRPKRKLLVGACIVFTPFTLADNTYQLDKVVVSAKAPVNATEFAGSVTVISAEDIRASGATSVTEVMDTVPGVQLVVTGSNSGKAPQLRGQDTDQVLVLVNGKRLPNTDRNLPFAPSFRYNWVPLANIERIEVIRGPASSLYGADALAGVINIITRKADSTWQGNISLYGKVTDDANGGDGEGLSLATSGPITDSADLAIAIESTHVDAILDDDDQLSLSSERDNESIQADLGFDLSTDDRLQFGFIYGKEEGNDTDSRFGSTSNIPLNTTRRRATLDYQTKLGQFTTHFGLLTSDADVEEGSSIWEVGEDGASIDLQGQLTDAQYLSLGINYRKEEAIRTDSVIFDNEVNATTLFVQDVIDINTNNTLTLGLAYDNHSKYDDESSPKINWFSQLTPTLGFKAGYGESYLAPSLRESSSAYVVPAGPTRVYVGNDDLQPETAQTVELGLTYKKKNIAGSITAFRTEVDNLIALEETVTNPGPPPVTTAEYNNIDEALIQGLETEWTFLSNSHERFGIKSNNTKATISYTYLDTENRQEDYRGNELPNRAKHSAKFNLSHQTNLWGIRFDAGIRYLSDQYTDLANTEELDAYTIADIGFSKTLWKELNVRFGIDNVGNKTVLDDSAFELIEEGRTFQLTLSSTF
jgi:outer membrane receptor for ferrienterochelin and colicins